MNKSKKYIESYNQIDELHYKNFYVKEPIFCEMINENEYKAYDGKREFIVSKKEKKELSEYKRNKGKELDKYILCTCSYCGNEPKGQMPRHSNIKDCFDNFVSDNEKIQEITIGINMNISGNIIDTAKRIAFKSFFERLGEKAFNKIEFVNNLKEYNFINHCRGALIASDKYDEVDINCYDMNSQYPFVLSSKDFWYPIKEGEYMTLTNAEEALDENNKFKFGIYKCTIDNKKSDINKKLFGINKKGYYTHEDLDMARKLKYEIKMKNENDNFIYYSKDKLYNGKKTFEEYFNMIYDNKCDCNDKDTKQIFKDLMNRFIGYLIQERKIKYNIDAYEPQDSDYIVDRTVGIVEVLNKNNPYYSRFARIKPFLYMKTRTFIIDMYESHVDDVVRVHTDGFYVKKDSKLNIEVSDKLGGLKFEYAHKVEIIESNEVNIICPKCNNKYYFKDSHICKDVKCKSKLKLMMEEEDKFNACVKTSKLIKMV